MSAPARLPFVADPYDYGEARRIADQLSLADPVAITLVRRGHRTVEQARAFLEADLRHPASLFEGIERSVALIAAALAGGRRITVHGDYDVDGICATAIVVGGLRRAGADCDWLIPDRLSDGYGLTPGTVERLRERATDLLITVDCGITSVEEVAAVRAAGIDVIVTDHHQPADVLPDCPIVHPVVCGYPFAGLCGAAVAYKLIEAVEAELGSAAGARERDLDLVALATIADMVPLVDENRALARAGLRELRRARRPGTRALMAAAAIEPERLDEGDIGFRIAPRLNAAGRLYRADAGVELMLTDDPARAATIAAELDAANHERRATERGVLHEAEGALRALSEELRRAPALVLAGEGWHPGVVGIVASRIVERHDRPAIVLSIDEQGRARGSGRSVPGFDLLAGLEACATHLDRFGGHRAAAGVELPGSAIDGFRAAFIAHASAAIPEEGLVEPERIDAVVGAEGLDLQVAEQLEALAPFGQGNPGIRLLVPGARVDDLRPMGAEGQHARFNLATGGLSARGVAFNSNGKLEAAQRAPHDLTVRLELNHWNGAIEPRAVLDGAHRRPGPAAAGEAIHRCDPEAIHPWWWQRFDAEIERRLDGSPARAGHGHDVARTPVDARRGSALARIGELISSGSRVLVVGADAGRRAVLVEHADPGRFGGLAEIACLRCGPGSLAASAAGGSVLVVTDFSTLSADPAPATDFEHVVALDPPPRADLDELLRSGIGTGYLHSAWGSGPDLAELCWDSEWQIRSALAEIYRVLAAAGELGGSDLGVALRGPSRFPRSPEAAARCMRILDELGISASGFEGDARWLRCVSSERTALERSGAWRAYAATHQEGRKYLQSRRAAP